MATSVREDPTKNALQEAIEALYTAFPARSYTGPLTYSPALDLARKSVTLARAPRRAVDRELLIEYGRRAMTTWGEAADFLYFLPCLLEITVLEPWPELDPEILFSKLPLADWPHLPEPERHAVERFFQAFWEDVLAHHPSRLPMSTALVCLSSAGLDLSSYLDSWLRQTTREALRHLADIVGDLESGQGVYSISSPFWPSGQEAIVLARLQAPSVGRVLSAFFFDAKTSEEDRLAASRAVEIWERFTGVAAP